MKNLQAIIRITFLVLVFSILPQIAHTQPDPPGGHGSDQDVNPGGGAPIDGGLTIMIALGVGYGLGKLYELQMKKLED